MSKWGITKIVHCFSDHEEALGSSKFFREREIGIYWTERTLSLNYYRGRGFEWEWSDPVFKRRREIEVETAVIPAYRWFSGRNPSKDDFSFTSNPWFPYQTIPFNLVPKGMLDGVPSPD